jgi:hypothetical protein
MPSMRSWSRVNAPELPELPVFAHAAVAGDHVYDCIAYRPSAS